MRAEDFGEEDEEEREDDLGEAVLDASRGSARSANLSPLSPLTQNFWQVEEVEVEEGIDDLEDRAGPADVRQVADPEVENIRIALHSSFEPFIAVNGLGLCAFSIADNPGASISATTEKEVPRPPRQSSVQGLV